MPSALETQLTRHRRQIVEREEQAFRELLTAYEVIESDLRREYRELQRRIIAARDAGEEISEAWLHRERRLTSLLEQVKQQVVRFGRTAAAITTREQRAAIAISANQSREMMRILGSPAELGFTLPTRVVEDAVGMLGNGSPILEYYREQLAPKVAEMIRIEVIKAVAQGTDFRTIANRLVQTGQITRTRALMVARTETNRVRREALRQGFIESDVVTQWEWVASKSLRTCPACLWLDGQRFSLATFFPQHPNCRCTMIPVIEGVESPPRTLGRDWVKTLGPDDLKEIFGKEAAEALERGEITHGDLVGWRNSREFGRSVFTRPLSAVMDAGGEK